MSEFQTLSDLGFVDSDDDCDSKLLKRIAIAHGENLEDLVAPFDKPLSEIISNLTDLKDCDITVPEDVYADFLTSSELPDGLVELLESVDNIKVDSVSRDFDMPTSQRYFTAHCSQSMASAVLKNLCRLSASISSWLKASPKISSQIEANLYEADQLEQERRAQNLAIRKAEEIARKNLSKAERSLALHKVALEIVRKLQNSKTWSVRNFHYTFGMPMVLLADSKNVDALDADIAKFLVKNGLNVVTVNLIKLRPDTMTQQSYYRYSKKDAITGYYFTDWLGAYQQGDVKTDDTALAEVVGKLFPRM